ncbi:MAG: ABC transporter ATP-binding protein [Spirochaetaceae bacterium]|jgi:energy-coupling factor transport system ATP-binding protein|nr:ABC transporter ATP-binding protein [Spirochaetaceae bacterium]
MISFEHVSFSYPGQQTGSISDLNLTIQDGECVLFCGRSGCGKTTVTRLINGLIPCFFTGKLSGKVTVDNLNIAGTPMYRIAEHIGSVFQNPRTQFFNVDTDSEIAFGIENESLPPGELHRRVTKATEDLHIQNLRGRNIFALSGGEKQKIAFASVYAMRPGVYLLDEPSSNLDIKSIGELKEHLRLIKAQGSIIIVAEHRIYYLMELVDRIIHLEQGRVTGIYTPAELTAFPEARRSAMGLRAADLYAVRPRVQINNPDNPPSLELRDVAFRYEKRIILEHITLKAARGEIIGVVGRNGAGKTTFSRALCGLHKNTEGKFLWEGRQQDRRARMKRSYLVMQDVNYELFAESVEQECILGIDNPDKALAASALELLGMVPYKDRHPNTLSGGQKQRVAVAVSMVCGKDILVFDEPTSGLDYDSMIQVTRLLENLKRMGKIVFLVSHDYEFICHVCSRVLHFAEGEMPDDIMISSQNLEKLRMLFGLHAITHKET